MNRAPVVMAVVAGVAGAGGVAMLVKRGASEGAIYARRIGATMLFALAIILGFFAWSLASWGAGA